MKLRKILTRLVEEEGMRRATILDTPDSESPDATEDASILVVINQIESNPKVIAALRELQTLTAKYKLILQFAQMLGISREEFHNTITNMQIYQKQNEE